MTRPNRQPLTYPACLLPEATRRHLFCLSLLLTLWLLPATAAAQTACAVYNSQTRVLTFMGTPHPELGDNEAIVVHFYPNKKSWWNGTGDAWAWPSNVKEATKIVIKEDFIEYPLYTCYRMFYDFYNLTTFEGLEYLELYHVGDMSYMFDRCYSLTSLDLSNLQVQDVNNMSGMFARCSKLIELVLPTVESGTLKNTSEMFGNCSMLTELDLSGIVTGGVTDMSHMFSGCTSLTTLNLSGFSMYKVENMNSMFSGCRSLTDLDMKNVPTYMASDMGLMFNDCSSLTELDLSNFNTQYATNMGDMFNGCSSLTKLNVSSFNTSDVSGMESMFNGCSSLTTLDVSNFDTSRISSMLCMFAGCSSLTELDLSNFNTAKVTDMNYMFQNCSSLTSIDLSSFNTSKVSSMYYMFVNCTSLTELDLSSFNTTENLYGTYKMFSGCTSLTTLNLSRFNTTQTMLMSYMFEQCSALEEIFVGDGFTVGDDCQAEGMFAGCTRLPHFTADAVDKTHAHYGNGGYLLRLVGRQGKRLIGVHGNELRTSRPLELTDDAVLEIFEPFTATEASYKREFVSDEWQTLYLPYDLDARQIEAQWEAAMINNFHEYVQEDGSCHVELEAKRITTGSIPAYTPFLVHRKAADGERATLPLRATDAVLAASEGNVLDCASLSRQYYFTGTLEDKTDFDDQTDYLMRSGMLWQAATDDTLMPYRWYLTATDRFGSPFASSARAACISIKVTGPGSTTGIVVTPQDSTPKASQPVLRDLQGRPLRHAPQHGVYIKNGKKYVK